MKAKKVLLIVLSALLVVSAAIALAACNGDPAKTTDTKYTVTYANGAADATGEVPAVQSYAEGATFTLLPADTFSRTGYTFSSWSDGSNTYQAGASYTMPARNVTFTAQWTAEGSTPGGDEEEDIPVLTELAAEFYDSDNWAYMTNDNGASLDGGEVAYSLSDGSIKFHRANQAIELGDLTNTTVSFLLKGTNDWSIWFNSSSLDNTVNSSYRLAYAYSGLRIALSTDPESAAAAIVNTDYKKGEWNRFDVVFTTANGVCEIKVYVNGARADLATSASVEGVTVENNVMRHVQPEGFETGSYVAVKVWEANNYVQIKPVANKDTADDPIIACIGASITEGAGADDFYTESYPAQLQQALGNTYNVLNFGNSGKTVRTDLKDDSGNSVAWLDQPQWEGVQGVVPDIAIINMGTNDSKTSNDPATTKENFTVAFENLLAKLWEVNPDMRIYICTVPYAYTGIWDINNDNIRDIIAPVQRELAAKYADKCTLIDLYEYSQNKSMLFGDGVHPNTSGYAMFVEIIKTALLEGGDALTDEFIADIDARYNDVVSGFTAEIDSSDGLSLIVSGNTTLADGSDGIRVYVGTGDDNAKYFPAAVSGGKFSASIDFSELEILSDWYNVRIYAEGSDTNGYDGSGYHILLMGETEYAASEVFTSDEYKVTLRSWSSNWGSTFSFSLGANYTASVTEAVISGEDGALTLSVSGTANDAGLQLYVGQHPTNEGVYRTFTDVTYNSQNGTFTVTFDLASMPVAPLGNNGSPEWYNVRLYFSDGTYAVVPLSAATDGTDALSSGDAFYTEETKIQIVSWTDNNVGTLSFAVTEYDGSFVPEAEVTSAKIEEKDGQILLTVSGTTNDEGIRLYIGNSEENSAYYHAITVTEGSFTVSFDLAALAAGSGWYNVRIYYNEDYYAAGNTQYETVLFTDVVNDSGETIQTGDVFYGTGKKVTIQTWGNYNLLSLHVEEYSGEEPSVSVTVSSVGFEDGYFVVTGTATGVETINFYLNNTNVAGSSDYFATAEIGENGVFTARLSLEKIAAFAKTNTPFNLRYTVDGGDTEIVPQGALDLSQEYAYGSYTYTLKVNTGSGSVAVYYNAHNYKYQITNVTIGDVDGVATLTIEGTTTDSSIAFANLKLRLDKTSETKEQRDYENQATENGKFKFVVDISDLIAADDMTVKTANVYFLRLYNGDTQIDSINSKWASDKLFEEVRIGDSVYCFSRNNASAIIRSV